MYCSKCGEKLPEGSLFCSKCGSSTNAEKKISIEITETPKQKVVLDPSERSTRQHDTDYGEKTGGIGAALGLVLIIIGILCDLICSVLALTGSFEAFGYFIVGGTISFIIGFVIRLFCR